MKYALRTLLNHRGFTFTAVLILALGIGANTAIFSVVDAVFLRPLPYPAPEQLVEISELTGQGPSSVSYPNYLDWKPQVDVFESVAAHAVYPGTLNLAGVAEHLPVNYVSADFLGLLRTKVRVGRDFRPEDEKPGAAPVAILTHRLWQSRFGANPGVLGSAINVDRRDHAIIGVLPPQYHFYRGGDILIPISNAVTAKGLYIRDNHNEVFVLGRLKRGVGLGQAQAQMSTVAARLARAYPETNAGVGAQIVPLRQRVSGEARQPLTLLLSAVGLLLLLTCLNVANLLLARSVDRREEMALRAALGASRWQTARQLLIESVLLALAGGCLGVLVAWWSFAGLLRLVPASIAAGGLSIDLRVLGFTLLISLLTGILFGLAPLPDAVRTNPNDVLRAGNGACRARRCTLRDVLAVSQVGLALVLLIGAGLLLRTLGQLMNVRLGFQTESILTARVSVPDSGDLSAERTAAFFEQLVERAANVPGVRSAGSISHIPLTGTGASWTAFRDDRPVPDRAHVLAVNQRVASPGYFRSMGIPLLRGRLFTPGDGRISNFRRDAVVDWFKQNHFSVLISESFAKSLWPGEDPIGKAFRLGFPETGLPPVTVIGVVGDVREYGADSDPEPTFYWSGYHYPQQSATLVLRTEVQPGSLAPELRRISSRLEPAAVLTDVATVQQLVSDSLGSRRLHSQLLTIFAAIALLLAGVGVYGVMAYTVNRRGHEIGIRMALGATRNDILPLVMGKAALLGGLGVLLGVAAASVLTRLIAGMLYGVKAWDPLTFLAVALLLFGVTLAASYVPARRAMRVSPLTVLREQ